MKCFICGCELFIDEEEEEISLCTDCFADELYDEDEE